ncbi:MAG: radical SAM protein [Candidatus ainarchaeum sp.]|nr:radical SAM protein [Candidatus ainarchaeum sp.]MDD3975723.1 radical SAM protein [Candidatus ainarchaeum sp.]
MDNQIFYFKKGKIWAGFNRFTLKTAYSKNKNQIYDKLYVNKNLFQEGKDKLNKYKFRPHIFYLIPTLDCNLNCNYCFIKNRLQKSSINIKNYFMSTSTAKKAINLFLNYYANKSNSKGFILNIYGGEPLLNWPVVKISIIYWNKLINLKNKGSTINIITNGILLNEDMILFFKKYNVNLSISVDGDEFVSEKNRLGLNYNILLKNINLLIKCGVNYTFSFTLNLQNIDCFKSQIKYLLNFKNLNKIFINFPLPLDVINFDYTNLDYLLNKYFELFKTFTRKHGVFDNFYSILLYRFINQKIGYHHCPCNKCQIVVDPTGNIGPCQSFLGDLNYFPGNIYNNYDLDKIDLFKNWVRIGSYVLPECKNCIGIGLCRGGCRYVSQKINHCPDGVDIRFCKIIYKFIEFIVWETYTLIESDLK